MLNLLNPRGGARLSMAMTIRANAWCARASHRMFSDAFKVRFFSWKSRLNRDPELRQRKIESLNRRYALRRIDILETSSDTQQGQLFSRMQDSIASILGRTESRIEKLVSIESLDKSAIELLNVGTEPLERLGSVRMTGLKHATVFVNDRGNIDRVYKTIKAAYPFCMCTIIDRDRIELKIPRLTGEFRLSRGEEVTHSVKEARKQIKKLELSIACELKKNHSKDHEIIDKVKQEFEAANKLLDDAETHAIDKLGLE
jgi:ribosome recycling factor